MMKIHLFLLTAVLCVFCSSCKKEKLAIAGSGWQEIAIVDKASGVIEWRHSLDSGDECNDIEVAPNGNILYAYSNGARLINRNHDIIWDYKAGENEKIHTATTLKDGGYMIAVCGEPARIVELDDNGNKTKDIKFNTAIFDIHNQFRQVFKTDSGTYLVPLIGKQKILQITPEGRNKGSIHIGYDLFSVKVLNNNNLLVSCGKDQLFAEVDPENKQINSAIITNSIIGGSLLYVAEIQPYKNGNKLIANSNMHSNDRSQPMLIEINEANEIVWSLPFNKEIKNITSVYSFYE